MRGLPSLIIKQEITDVTMVDATAAAVEFVHGEDIWGCCTEDSCSSLFFCKKIAGLKE